MANTDQLIHFFSSKFPFNKEGLEEFATSFTTKTYPKGTLLLANDKIDLELRFLDQGHLREFYTSAQKEKCINFYTEPEFITDFFSFTKELPTKRNQESLTEVTIRSLSKEKCKALIQKYPCGAHFIDSIFQDLIQKKETTEFNFFKSSPEELYAELVKTKSHWIQHIPQYHLASYLGIQPETLSRIKKRL
jgi:CRP-like cAMP-binding protein